MSTWADVPGDVLSIAEIHRGVRVTWQDDDEAAPVIHTAELELEYERPDRSVGLNGGYSVVGDAPAWVLEHVAEWALERAADDLEAAAEQRAEYRAEAGW